MRTLFTVAVLLQIALANAWSQEPSNSPPAAPAPGQDYPDGTLASADDQASQGATGNVPDVDEPGTLPPIDVVPPANPDADRVIDNTFAPGLTPQFPSMLDDMIDGLGDGLRGAPMSIFDSPRSIDIITQQDLLERNPIDIGEALERTPGVMIQRTGRGQSSPFVRGLTGQQVLIMIDGVRMTNSTFRAGPNQYFNLIDPNMVERIEVIRGAGSVLYGGDAIGGVINVVTKGQAAGGNTFLSAGTVQRFSSADLGYTGRLNFEGSVRSLGIFAGGGYGNYNNLDIGGSPDAPPGFDVGRQPASSWAYHSADIKLRYSLSSQSEVVLATQHYQAEDVFRTDRFPANRESIFDPQARQLFYLRWQGVSDLGIIDTYQITASLHRFDEERADRDFRPGRNPLLTSYREFTDEQTGITGSFTTDLGDFGTLSYGWDWYHDELASGRTDVDASVNPPTVTNRPGGVPDDGFYSRYGGFLNWDVWLTSRLQATAGVRYEHVTAGATVTANNVTGFIDPEYQDWIGHAGLTYELSDSVHLVGSINEGFRAPNIDDLATINDNVFVGTQLPNPTLMPENSITYELGVKVNGDRLRAQTFFWWNDLRNYIVRSAPNAQDLLERSNGDAYLYGAEGSFEYLLNPSWSLYGNAWYTYGENVTDDEPISRIPPLQGLVGLRKRWDNGRSWLDVYTWLVDQQDRLAARDISDVNRIPPGGTPGFVTLNARLGLLLTDYQRISLNVENLLDEQYRVHGSGSDGAGINAVLSYELLQ